LRHDQIPPHAIAHNKVMVIDRETVITGSFNFTRAAEEKNAENLLIIKSNDLARAYIDNWSKPRDHYEPYQARYYKEKRKWIIQENHYHCGSVGIFR
jgi:phosphatidylserine/phosphatidylglycerophosphate/cardiolipin synthase-like enzyme